MAKFPAYPQASYVDDINDYLIMAQGSAGTTKKLNTAQLHQYAMTRKSGTIWYVGDSLYLDARNPFQQHAFLTTPRPIFLWTAVDEPGAYEFYLINVGGTNANLDISVHTFFDQSGNPYQHGQALCSISKFTNYDGSNYIKLTSTVHNDFFGTNEVDLYFHVFSPWETMVYDQWDIN